MMKIADRIAREIDEYGRGIALRRVCRAGRKRLPNIARNVMLALRQALCSAIKTI